MSTTRAVFAAASLSLIAAVALLIPVYRSRNHGFVEPADLAARSLAVIQDAARHYPGVTDIVVDEDPAPTPPGANVTLDSAFGALFPDAVHLFVGPDVRGTLGTGLPRDSNAPLVFVLRRGRLVQLDVLRPTPSV